MSHAPAKRSGFSCTFHIVSLQVAQRFYLRPQLHNARMRVCQWEFHEQESVTDTHFDSSLNKVVTHFTGKLSIGEYS